MNTFKMPTIPESTPAKGNPRLGGWNRFQTGILLIALILLIKGAASAQSIQFTVMSALSPNGASIPAGDFVMLGQSIPGYWAGEIDITVSQYAGQNLTPAPTVPTFCIQLTQDINLNTTYTNYLVAPIASADEGTLTTQAAQELTTLYYLFYQGNSSSNWNAITATAFQLDCWKVTSNPGNFVITGSTAGSTFYDSGFAASGTTGAAIVALAQSWLTTVSGTIVTTGGVMQPVALTEPTEQDLIFTEYIQSHLIPFKINAWPGAAGLASVIFFRMRRRMKRAR
jgi:hypothetical protein